MITAGYHQEEDSDLSSSGHARSRSYHHAPLGSRPKVDIHHTRKFAVSYSWLYMYCIDNLCDRMGSRNMKILKRIYIRNIRGDSFYMYLAVGTMLDNMTRQRDAPYPKSSIVYINLTLNVIRGHWRSLIRSKSAKNMRIHPGPQLFAYKNYKYYELYHSNLRGN